MNKTKQFLRPLLMAIVMLVGMLMPKGAWAQSSPVTVGDQGFSTIQEAIDEIVYGGLYDATLTLHQDFTLEGDIGCIDIYFNAYSEDFNFTIDLNGHTITGGCEWNSNDIYFRNDGSGLLTVTIANSCQDKKGKLFNCRLYLNPNTKVIVNEGVSIYPSFELLDFALYVVHIENETSSVENYGDIYGGVMVGPGGSFINNGRVAYVNGEFENNGSHCAYFNWADDGSSFSAFVYDGCTYDYNEWDVDTSITSEVTKEPTCSEPGVRTFTGTVFYGGQEFTDTKEVEIPAGHSYTNKTLTASPIEDGLYAYACDYGCGTHTDDHIIKDFNGAGNHLELTKDGEGNYSTSEDITLADANGFVSPVDFTAPSVTYTRTGIKNQFGTLVVPFDVNGIGADYDLYKLDQVCENELVLRMVDVDDNGGIVPTGTPVIFRLHDDLAGDYSLTLTAANTAVSGQLAEGSAADGLQLVGTYETTVLDENDYFISNNQFWRVYDAMAEIWSWGVKVAPFRAYIHPTELGAKANSLSIRIADEVDDVTAVETLNALTEGNAEYYDMNGRKLNSLQNGVNIVKYGNGKTVKVNIK